MRLQLNRVAGESQLVLRIFAPGNLFLQEVPIGSGGEVITDALLLPVDGLYIIQVARREATFSPLSATYTLRAEAVSP
ncbi:MAG: hypothetical protein HC915_11260 [Anaerolineae bacterium]|nr:hypothetical protein [Anaerolineae bacterium]